MEFIDKFLDEVAFYQEGPGVRKFQFRNEGVKLLNVGNINKGLLDTSTTKLYISEEEAYGKYKHFLVDEGDLLIASSGIVVDNFHNKIAYAKKEHLPLCLNTSTIRFKSLDDNLFYLDYLKFYLKTNHFKKQLRKLITGAAQLNFGPSHLKKIKLPIPSLQNQHHIANLLSKAETLITQRKETLRLLDEYLKSTFLEMFGDPAFNSKNWEKVKFRDLIAKGDKINYGIVQPGEDGNKIGVAIIRVGDFNGIRIIGDNLKLVDPAIEQKHKASRLLGDELLIACVGATIGKIALTDSSHAGKNIVRAIARIRCDSKKLNRLYLCQLLLTSFYQFNLKNLARTIAQPTLNIGQIEEIRIILPPLTLQNQFAQIVEKTEALKTQYHQSLQELENLYNTLSQKAFRGELGKG